MLLARATDRAILRSAGLCSISLLVWLSVVSVLLVRELSRLLPPLFRRRCPRFRRFRFLPEPPLFPAEDGLEPALLKELRRLSSFRFSASGDSATNTVAAALANEVRILPGRPRCCVRLLPDFDDESGSSGADLPGLSGSRLLFVMRLRPFHWVGVSGPSLFQFCNNVRMSTSLLAASIKLTPANGEPSEKVKVGSNAAFALKSSLQRS